MSASAGQSSTAGDPPEYPAHREADVALRDGSTVHVRPVRPADLGAMLDFLKGLSRESRAFRFFSASVDLEREARRSVDVDHRDRYGLVATSGIRITINVVPNGYHLQIGDLNEATELFVGTQSVWRVCNALLRIIDLVSPVESN